MCPCRKITPASCAGSAWTSGIVRCVPWGSVTDLLVKYWQRNLRASTLRLFTLAAFPALGGIAAGEASAACATNVANTIKMRRRAGVRFCLLAGVFAMASCLLAQEPPAALSPSGTTPPPTQTRAHPEGPNHRFWDRPNAALFAGVGAARALDYASSQHFRAQGINERLLSNRIVDNKPLFVSIEVGATFASIGVAYLFHRSGHHKLERWTSILHIGVGLGGAARNYALKRDPSPDRLP
jgi:hypothetical protein